MADITLRRFLFPLGRISPLRCPPMVVIFLNSLCDAFQAEAVEAGFGFGGNQPISGLLWRSIAAVTDDDDWDSILYI